MTQSNGAFSLRGIHECSRTLHVAEKDRHSEEDIFEFRKFSEDKIVI